MTRSDSDDMRRLISLAMMLCLVSGCMRPMLQRLDLANAQITETNTRLAEMSEKLDVANQKLATFEKAARMIIPGIDKK